MPLPAMPFSPVVDIIVPVYRGLEMTRACIRGVLDAEVSTPFRLVVVNDDSPEPELSSWLECEVADSRVIVLRNERNQGFVRSANRGMTLHPDHDVVLLNSDAQVYGSWLDRLRVCAYREPDIGTVTPLTNNGTLASYPRFMAENNAVSPEDAAFMDDLVARVNAGLSKEIPTAVGFCMYIRRACLEQVGYFDARAFGKGYGEENEFCMRAADVGWSHRLCGDVFVHHCGGGSFGAEAEALKSRATEVLNKMRPDYAPRIEAFVRSDPGRALRRRLDLARMLVSPKPRVLFVTHRQGGGVERHCADLALALSDDLEILTLKPDDQGWLKLEWLRPGEEMVLHFQMPRDYEHLKETLRLLGVSRVHVHHVMEHPQGVLRLPEDLGVPMDFTIHDYYSICPQYNLTDEHGEYCGEPDSEGCTRCLAVRPGPWGLDIHSWRTLFRRLLTRAERVIAPSEDVRRRLGHYVPEAGIDVLPHFVETDIRPMPRNHGGRMNGEIRVLVLGVVNPAKGVRLLERCVWDVRHRGLPLHYVVVGWSETEIRGLDQLPLEFTGPYDPKELPALLLQLEGDIVFFPSRAPETFSYTLSEALLTGLPIVGPDFGAFPERTNELERVVLLPPDTDAATWNDQLLQCVRTGSVSSTTASEVV